MRRPAASFHAGAIENLVGVGATEKNSVRIWLRSSEPGTHERGRTRMRVKMVAYDAKQRAARPVSREL